MKYPVQEIVPELKQKLAATRIVILQAPPGAGKSTVLPLELFHEPWLDGRKIVMLEPRRLAARSVAMRMASLQNEEVGRTIGYRVRFETKISDATKIEVVTEGILTRMIQHDNSLEEVGLLIFDEFHERSLQADLALALSIQVQQVLRDDLRILIMSATLDSDKLAALLNAPVVTSQGRQFPVTLQYISVDQTTWIATSMAKSVRKAFHENAGDILAFFPGAGEIQRAAELLEAENLPVSLHPLFGDLSFAKQQQAIMPHPQGLRKIVLATSIAETSLTIDGITVVVDSGYSRVPKFDPRSGLTRLETVRVTKDAADQRAGRAGRLGPGVCYRLWSEGIQSTLVANRTPEILDADLAPLLLELYQWGIKDVNVLTWITPPPLGAVNQAKELLHALEAVQNDHITERGKRMLRLPTHPRIAHMLIEAMPDADKAKDTKIAALATDIAALLEERDPLPKEAGADLALRVEVLRRWRSGERVSVDRSALERIEKLASAWRRLLKVQEDNTVVADTDLGMLIIAAYPERVARQTEKHSERYKLMNGRIAKLPSHDPLTREPWIVVAQLDAGSGEGKIFQAAALDERDLMEQAVESRNVVWDEERGMVVGSLEKRIGNLVLSSKIISTISAEERITVLCTMIREKGLRVLEWGEKLEFWQARVLSLKLWRPEESWPDVHDEYLLQTLELWLAPFLDTVSKRIELQRLPGDTILSTILSWELNNKLDQLAPERLSVPSGSLIPLKYFFDGRPPAMEVRLQEVFGLLETPTVNEGRTKIILHLLSPGYKPVQVTQDLKSFWTNTYPEVRKELRTRYLKHSWPEDPWTAQAVRGAKKRGQG
jgi:ATP-dependent helicase HrpB